MSKYYKKFLWNKLRLSLKNIDKNYNNLRDSKFLITGGTGFVGSWIVHSLALLNNVHKLNIEITILTSKKENCKKYFFLKKLISIKYLLSDISKFSSHKYNFTHLIHCCGVYKENKSKINKVNILGTRNISKIAKNNNIKNIIFLSSGAVYNKSLVNKKLKEKSKKIDKKSNDYYSLSKIKGEEILNDYYKKNRNVNLTILRLFSFVGPGTSSLKYLAYTTAFESRFKNKDISLLSDGESTRSFMHSIDMACWIIKSLKLKKLNIVNVGSEKELKIIDMVKLVSSIKINNYKTVNVKRTKNTKDNSYYVPSVKKALKMNFVLNYNLKQAIKDHFIHKKISKNHHRYYFDER